MNTVRFNDDYEVSKITTIYKEFYYIAKIVKSFMNHPSMLHIKFEFDTAIAC